MARRNRINGDYQRAAIADEAARIMQEQGISDYLDAKEKAARRLGLKNAGPLPSNGEIRQALGERIRIFGNDHQPQLLERLRSVAVMVMDCLDGYRPRLVGPVLSGHATEHSNIDLHLFSDAAEDVGVTLDSHGIRHRPIQNHYRMRRETSQAFPAFRFNWGDFEVIATVFPERFRGHAPLSPVSGRPMDRASRGHVHALLHPVAARREPGF